jgi:ubiquinone/menaquinone biosynthesis C-methylase UbiE
MWRKGVRGLRRFLHPPDPQAERARTLKEADSHPERLAVLPYCAGRGIDVGCGYRKTTAECIGVDLLPMGAIGKDGVMKGKPSAADVCASGDNLRMFADGELDFVVARHNLEHYVDVFKTLEEWKRVLRPGGVMAIVLPDERHRNTIALDPTHKHAFTPESFVRYPQLIGGLEIVKLVDVVPEWSFLCVCKKTLTSE